MPVTRTLLLVGLCLAFPDAQRRVIEGRRTISLQEATGAAHHAPLHDWRQVGGGATRAVERRLELSPDAAWATASPRPAPTAHRCAREIALATYLGCPSPPMAPRAPLRI